MQSVTSSTTTASVKSHLIWFVPVAAVIALIVLMQASGNGQTIEKPVLVNKPWVNVKPIEWDEKYVQERAVIGRVEAKQTASVGFDLAGQVVNVLVDEGQDVVEGQILAEMDKQRLVAQLNELSAQLNRTQSDAKLAALSFKRLQGLVEKKLESAQKLDESREALKAANAFVDEVVARKETLLVELDKTQLRAPFDGSIASRLVDNGTVVSAGQALFNLQQNDDLEVRFALSASYADNLVVGQFIDVSYASSAISQDSKRTVKCQIISISKRRRLDTRTVDVIAKVLEPSSAVLPGDLLSFSANSEIKASGAWVPRTALVSGVRGLWSIFAVEQKQDEHVLVAKLVEVIYADDEDVYIHGALLDDEKIVTEGVHKLVPEQKVLISTHIASNSNII